ncbi:hypothetical protein [Aureivirga marina]|uniref:hypothetical protein n=1 Tax=Aureivirga marina TaxID=1182451 RepID=UPI0018CBC2A2|nr:hypothetical protein [Aureivirga marina]
MKLYYKISFIFVFLLFSCNQNKSKNNAENQEISTNKNNENKSIKTEPYSKYLYVSAKSGLNYRNVPKGKVLGKFPLNQLLKIVSRTNITEEIKDENEIIKGEWLGVEYEKDTVYVFNGFLSPYITPSDIDIFLISSMNTTGDEYISTINVSEVVNLDSKHPILKSRDLSKKYIRLNSSQKKSFYKSIPFSEKDTIYVYDYSHENILKSPVSELDIVATLSGYIDNNPPYDAYDYYYSFDVDAYPFQEHSYVFIGKENPFQTNQLEEIIWKKIPKTEFPKEFSLDLIKSKKIKQWFEGATPGDSYKFNYKHFEYYIQILKKESYLEQRYFIIKDTISNKFIFETVQYNSEGSELNSLITEDSKYSGSQLTGTLFKNKPPVIFGFYTESFGCTGFTFLDKLEPPITIRCDNRH